MKPQLIDQIGKYIEANGPATIVELRQKIECSNRGIRSAIERAARVGVIHHGTRRECRITGRVANTWALADDWRQIVERDHAMQRIRRRGSVGEANSISAAAKAWRAATRCPRDGRQLAVRRFRWMTVKRCPQCKFTRQVSRA